MTVKSYHFCLQHGCSGIQTRSCSSSSHCTGCLGLYTCNLILGKCQLKGLSRQTGTWLCGPSIILPNTVGCDGKWKAGCLDIYYCLELFRQFLCHLTQLLLHCCKVCAFRDLRYTMISNTVAYTVNVHIDILYITRYKRSWWKTGKGEKSAKSCTEASVAINRDLKQWSQFKVLFWKLLFCLYR